MKTKFLMIGLGAFASTFISCKTDEEKQAEMTVDRYEKYVDSVANVSADEAKANWEAIEAEYARRTTDAEAALASMKDREAAQKRLDDKRAKYEEIKSKYVAEIEAAQAAADPRADLRRSFFGEANVGVDRNFGWVNKDNILQVYNDFYNEFDKNQNSYSREDLDEIKAMYEALDARKNTVEKEGLSPEDNRKIAEIKVKFAPKFRWERITAKGDENKDAKDAAK
ncbi:MAG TPA: hypothetical protein PLA69_00580 [Flavobacterium sp.]|nr:hypothetical protein [Flavobacterium sp.]